MPTCQGKSSIESPLFFWVELSLPISAPRAAQGSGKDPVLTNKIGHDRIPSVYHGNLLRFDDYIEIWILSTSGRIRHQGGVGVYSVMIAEDEMLVRIGLVASVPWAELGLSVVAEEADGKRAYEAYLKHHPDIVVADIKIPGMNGIELLRAIREQDPTCVLIVITCVEEFAVLKEAISLGVAAYLVKATMDTQDIVDAMRKACQMLESSVRPKKTDQLAEAPDELLRRWILEQRADDRELTDRVRKYLGDETAGFLYARLSRNGGISELLRLSHSESAARPFSAPYRRGGTAGKGRHSASAEAMPRKGSAFQYHPKDPAVCRSEFRSVHSFRRLFGKHIAAEAAEPDSRNH